MLVATDRRTAILEKTDKGLDYILNYVGDIEFHHNPNRNEYRSKGKGTISIRLQGDRWTLKDWSGKLESGDIFSIHQTLTGLSDFKTVLSDLAKELGIEGESFAKFKPRPRKAAKPQRWIPNKGKDLTISYSYKIAITTTARDQHFGKWAIDSVTLDRYGIVELESITSTNYNSTKSGSDVPLFLIPSGENLKVRAAAPIFGRSDAKRKVSYLQSSGNLVFGFDQLPDSCKGIIIAAGEKDTLALNAQFNHQGIYAICLNSEGANLHADLYKDLRGRTDQIFVLYDNDKTGLRESEKICKSFTAIKSLSVPDWTQNDICDYIEAEGASSLKAEIERQIRLHNDPLYFHAARRTLRFDGFISDDHKLCESIKDFVLSRNKSQIIAPAGSGKTTYIFESLKDQIATVENRLIFAVPTQTLADQVANKYNLPIIMQGSGQAEFLVAENTPAVVCVYDSLPKIEYLLKDSTLVIDESHHLVADAGRGYKFDQINQVWELSEMAERVVLLSATPSPYIVEAGFEFLELRQRNPKPVEIVPLTYADKQKRTIQNELLNLDYSEKVHILFQDSTDSLELYRDALIESDKLKESEILLLSSDNKKSIGYQSIINNNRIPDKIKIVLTTQLIADGVSILNDNIGRIMLVNVTSEELFIQFPIRFRALDKYTVYSYRSELEAKEATQAAESLRRNLSQCERLASTLNDLEAITAKETGFPVSHSFLNSKAVYHSSTKGWQVSFAFAAFQEMEQRNRLSNAEQMYDRICLQYPHIALVNPEQPAPIDHRAELLQSVEAKRKRKAAKAKAGAYQALQRDPKPFITAVYQSTTDYNIKKEIEALAPELATKEPMPEAIELKKREPELFTEKKAQTPIKQYLKIRRMGFTHTAALKVLGSIKNDSQIARLRDRVLFQSYAILAQGNAQLLTSSELTTYRTLARYYQLIESEIELREKAGMGDEARAFTGKELANLIAGFEGITRLSERRALDYLRCLFTVSETCDKVEGKTIRLYEIGNRIRLSDVLKPFDMDPKDLILSYSIAGFDPEKVKFCN